MSDSGFFTESLASRDPELYDSITSELGRQREPIAIDWINCPPIEICVVDSLNSVWLQIRSTATFISLHGHVQINASLSVELNPLLQWLAGEGGEYFAIHEGHFLAVHPDVREKLARLAAIFVRKSKDLRVHRIAAIAVAEAIQPFVNVHRG